MVCIKTMLQNKNDIKVIIMSATIDTTLFKNYFSNISIK